MIGVITMVHLGTNNNAAGEDVTELVKTGQYALGDRANDYLNRILHAGDVPHKSGLGKAKQDTQISA